MFKKLILVTAMMVASSVALANGAPYVGASAGVNTDVFNVKDDFGNTINFGGRGAVGNIFAGYGAMISQSFYLGGEVFANRRFMTIRNGPNNANDLRPSYQWGVSVLPGIVFDSYSLGYARFGAVSSRFGKIGETKTGVQVGAGLEVKAISTVYLNGEYTYTRYRSLSAVIGAPTSDQFSLGVVFRFPGY